MKKIKLIFITLLMSVALFAQDKETTYEGFFFNDNGIVSPTYVKWVKIIETDSTAIVYMKNVDSKVESVPIVYRLALESDTKRVYEADGDVLRSVRRSENSWQHILVSGTGATMIFIKKIEL